MNNNAKYLEIPTRDQTGVLDELVETIKNLSTQGDAAAGVNCIIKIKQARSRFNWRPRSRRDEDHYQFIVDFPASIFENIDEATECKPLVILFKPRVKTCAAVPCVQPASREVNSLVK